jgi:hypothetical protein
MAEVILNSIIMRLDEMRFLHFFLLFSICQICSCSFSVFFRSRTGTEESKSTKNSSLINVALSVTVGGYYAHTKESIQDIRWSMQGYRKLLVAEIESEYVMLNMLQRLVKFSSKIKPCNRNPTLSFLQARLWMVSFARQSNGRKKVGRRERLCCSGVGVVLRCVLQ